MSTQQIRSLAELEMLLARASEARRLALLNDFFALPIAISSADAIAKADLMEALACKLNDTVSIAEAQYQRGLALIEREKEDGSAPEAGERGGRPLNRAISNLKRAYSAFDEAEQEMREESQQKERRRTLLRDKARPKAEIDASLAAGIERLRKRKISAALALGAAHTAQNSLDGALGWYSKALKDCEARKAVRNFADVKATPLLAATREALGETHRALGNSEDALRELEAAVSAWRRLGESENTARSLSALARVYHAMGQFGEALAYHHEALDMYHDESSRYAMLGKHLPELACRYRTIAVKANMAAVHLDRGDAVTALEIATLAVLAYEEFRDMEDNAEAMATIGDIYDNIVTTRVTIGRAHAALQRWDSALDQYSEAYSLAQTHCRQGLRLPILLDVGVILRERGETDNAIETFQTALSIADELKEAVMRARAHRELAATFENAERYQEAYQYYRTYVEINNQIAVDQERTAAAVARIEFNTEQRELESKLLRERNAMLENDMMDFLANVGLNADGADAKGTGDEPAGDGAAEESRRVSGESAKTSAVKKWIYFQRRIEDLYSGFLPSLTQRVPTLTPKQIQVCALLRLGLDQDQIINALGMAPRTLETHRNRIRRQLGCDPGANLVTVLTSIGSQDTLSASP